MTGQPKAPALARLRAVAEAENALSEAQVDTLHRVRFVTALSPTIRLALLRVAEAADAYQAARCWGSAPPPDGLRLLHVAGEALSEALAQLDAAVKEGA